jgi:hypothetical protein
MKPLSRWNNGDNQGKEAAKKNAIDKYFGSLNMYFGFRDDCMGVFMNKSAEDFFDEYTGYIGGRCKEQKQNKFLFPLFPS